MSFGDDSALFYVVMNGEEQYSIWPSFKPIPEGWSSVGKEAPKADCLAYIEQHWTDMRPKSLRDALAARPGAAAVA